MSHLPARCYEPDYDRIDRGHTHHIDGTDHPCPDLTHCPSICNCPVDACTARLSDPVTEFGWLYPGAGW